MLPLALVLLAAAPSPSELPSAAAVFTAGNAPGAAGRLEIELGAALKKRAVTLANLEALFPPPPAAPADEGDARFTTGREAYDNLDFDAAIKALTEAAVFFIKRPASAKPEQLAEIFVFLGASELQNGLKADAKKDFVRALQINPQYAPDAKYFGADVLQAFAAAQKELSAKPKGILKVDSVPSGAEVSTFGLAYGMTPQHEIELPIGRYLVTLTRPGFAPAAVFPEVKDKQVSSVSPKLDAAPALLALRDKAEKLITSDTFEDDKLPPAAAEIGKVIKGRYLVMIQLTAGAKTHAEVQVWNVSSGDRLKGVAFDLDAENTGLDSAADKIEAWISRPLAVAAAAKEAEAEAEAAAEGPPGSRSVLKKWWFWTAIGAGVVAVSVTTGVVASQPRGPAGFNVILGQP